MKYLLGFLFLLSVRSVFAQKELFLTTSAGWKVSYNCLEYDKPLPLGLQWSRWSGFSSAAGLEYKISSHWGIHAQVKTASVEMGLKTRFSTVFDTVSNRYNSRKGAGGLSLTSHAPAHIQLGMTYYSNPIKGGKFSWLIGGGIAWLKNQETEKPGSSSGIGFNDSINFANNNLYGKGYDVNMVEEFSRSGILMNVHTGIDFHFASKHHLLLTIQHNEGLKRIWQFKTDYFNYFDRTPNANVSEAFDVTIATKGSYSALQVSYKYALFASK